MSTEKVRPDHLVRWISILTSPPLKISRFLLVDLLIRDRALFRAERTRLLTAGSERVPDPLFDGGDRQKRYQELGAALTYLLTYMKLR